jgi:hypothetical protein
MLDMAGVPGVASAKYKATGMKILLACTPDGGPAWISSPVDGRHHDMGHLAESGRQVKGSRSVFCGDGGFIESGMITPIRKPR